MEKASVMKLKQKNSAYIVDNKKVKNSDQDFTIKNLLYEEYRKVKENGFKGSYEEYLSVRDFA